MAVFVSFQKPMLLPPMSKQKKTNVKEMTPDEMRSEIYRLYRVRAEQSERIKEL